MQFISKYLKLGMLALIISLLSACTSSPPSKTLPQAKIAVTSVDHANYHNHAHNDIEAVKIKLAEAQKHALNKKHTLSEQLAQQILADVEWIQIKTQRSIVDEEVKQVEDSISNLNQELKWREPVQVAPLNKE